MSAHERRDSSVYALLHVHIFRKDIWICSFHPALQKLSKKVKGVFRTTHILSNGSERLGSNAKKCAPISLSLIKGSDLIYIRQNYM